VVLLAKIPRLMSWRMFTNYLLYLWCLALVICDCEDAEYYDGMAKALLGVRDALVHVISGARGLVAAVYHFPPRLHAFYLL
jgi:hypothetical protein